jgi:hypothetical protein
MRTLNATLTVSTTAPVMSAESKPLRTMQLFAALLLIGILPRRRRRKTFLMIFAFALVGSAVGCGGHLSNGGSSNTGPSTGNYQVTVTATSGAMTATTKIPLVVNQANVPLAVATTRLGGHSTIVRH